MRHNHLTSKTAVQEYLGSITFIEPSEALEEIWEGLDYSKACSPQQGECESCT